MKTILPKEPIFNFNDWINFIHSEVKKSKINNSVNNSKQK